MAGAYTYLQHLAQHLESWACMVAGLFLSGFLAPVPALLVLSSIKLHQLSSNGSGKIQYNQSVTL
jgi:hypothetical protein